MSFCTGERGRLVTTTAITQNLVMDQTPRQLFPAIATLEDGPFSALLGLRVEAAREGAVAVRMPFNPRLLNYGPPDVPIHGGAIASLADFAACAAVWTMPQTQSSATISLTVNYTAPGIQSELIARAAVRRAGKRVASITVEIHDRQGSLIADALVTYKIA
jgi:uncharacterized protein (TIGR00369 family)